MSYLRQKYSRGLIFSTLCFCLASDAAVAAKWDNPKKNDDLDLVLELPAGKDSWSLVLRKSVVPGDPFWPQGDTRRFIELGESGNVGVFEGPPIGVKISGVTRGDKDWNIWVGKYEVTVGQVAMVFGKGDVSKGLKRYAEYTNRDSSYVNNLLGDEKKLKSEMATPAHRMPPAYIQLFLRELNLLCYQNEDCRNTLPSVRAESTIKGEKYLPFFRLPTEIEWEYVARGVADNPKGYRGGRLPVSAGKIGNYAELRKLGRIARKKPIHGYYDLFGNVSEIVSGRMTAEIGSDNAGAWLAKGGKAGGATSKKPYSSQREEILEFEWRQEDKLPRAGVLNKVGFRIAFGVPLLAYDALAAVEREDVVAPTTGTATSTTVASPGSKAIDSLSSIVEDLLAEAGRGDSAKLKSLKSNLEAAMSRLKIEENERNVRAAKFLVDNTFIKLVRVWGLTTTIKTTKERIDLILDRKSIDRAEKKRMVDPLNKQITGFANQIKTLMQQYEEGLSAIADIPNVESSIVAETIDMNSYQSSDAVAALAETAKVLLEDHIGKKKAKRKIDIRRDIDSKYPL